MLNIDKLFKFTKLGMRQLSSFSPTTTRYRVRASVTGKMKNMTNFKASLSKRSSHNLYFHNCPFFGLKTWSRVPSFAKVFFLLFGI